MTRHTQTVDSPVGALTLVASDIGLQHVGWEVDPGDAVEGANRHLEETVRQLDEYFAGTRMTFDLPLDLTGTPFQLAAWHALATIPYGETVSYAEQAERIGRPTAVRAVGSANGRNPVAIVLPCHRVIATGGGLGGFGGGLEAKRTLLDLELRHAPRGL